MYKWYEWLVKFLEVLKMFVDLDINVDEMVFLIIILILVCLKF